MLAGRYPSDDFGELRPRITWDRVTDQLAGRPGAQRLAVTSGGTIPDRGLYTVVTPGSGEGGTGGSRVGELDEEMVYESRVGDTFLLGSTSWRVLDITRDRVVAEPAPGVPARMPFWKGDAPGRPLELGRALGAFVREVAAADDEAAHARTEAAGLDANASTNLLDLPARAEGVHAPRPQRPHHRRRALPRRAGRLAARRALPLRRAGQRAVGAGDRRAVPRDAGPRGVRGERGRRHRPAAARRPRRRRRGDHAGRRGRAARPGRGRAGGHGRGQQLRAVRRPVPRVRGPLAAAAPARPDPPHPAVAAAPEGRPAAQRREPVRAVPGGARDDARGPAGRLRRPGARRAHARRALAGGAGGRRGHHQRVAVRAHADVRLRRDVPLRARRPAGRAPRRRALARLHAARRAPGVGGHPRAARRRGPRRDRGPAPAHRPGAPRPRRGGHRRPAALRRRPHHRRGRRPAACRSEWLTELESARRAIRVRVAGEERWIAIEDAGPLPRRPRRRPAGRRARGVHRARGRSAGRPLARFARTRGPFPVAAAAHRFALGVAVVGGVLDRLVSSGRLVRGELRPEGAPPLPGVPADLPATGPDVCDAEVLRRLRRGSLARLRAEVEPVEPAALGRFLPSWHGIGPKRMRRCARSRRRPGRGRAARRRADPGQRAREPRAPGPAARLLPRAARRAHQRRRGHLDRVRHAGRRRRLAGGRAHRPRRPAAARPRATSTSTPRCTGRCATTLDAGGALFFRQLAERTQAALREGGEAETALPDDATLVAALWDLVWAGLATNDTLAPVRALVVRRRVTRQRGLAGRGAQAAPLAVAGPLRPARARAHALAHRPADGPGSLVGRARRARPTPTRRAQARTESFLERHGVLTRGALDTERATGGFAGIYPVLRAMEESGRARRGYVIEGLGAAQFAVPGAIDRLRAESRLEDDGGAAVAPSSSPPPTPPSRGARRWTWPRDHDGGQLPPPGPQGGRARRARRRRAGDLRRARRQVAAELHRRARRPHRRRVRAGHGRARGLARRHRGREGRRLGSPRRRPGRGAHRRRASGTARRACACGPEAGRRHRAGEHQGAVWRWRAPRANRPRPSTSGWPTTGAT